MDENRLYYESERKTFNINENEVITMGAYNPNAQFQTISNAARTTGFSQHYIRCGCRDKTIPFIMSGSKYLVNVPLMLSLLNRESESNIRTGV